MMRVTVFGTCQVFGIADALSYLLPSAKVFAIPAYAVATWPMEATKILECLSESDYVFAQPLHKTQGILSGDALREAVPKAVMIPVITFTGFHPDCIHIHTTSGKAVRSPMGPNNSQIIAAAYSMGLPSGRVSTLFNAFIYRKLGYYEEFEKARSYLHKHMEEYGLDLASVWGTWIKPGAFMNTANHPTHTVLASIARVFAERAGLVAPSATATAVPADWLGTTHPVWPVYPELARAIDVPGSYVFKYRMPPNRKGARPYIGLNEFIAMSYAEYERHPVEVFQSRPIKRVAEILADATNRPARLSGRPNGER